MQRLFRVFTLVTLSLLPLGCAVPKPTTIGDSNHPEGFVYTSGTHFGLDSRPFYVAGANHHYLAYAPAVEVANVLQDARDMGLNTLRVFAFLDIGSLDGSTRKTTSPVYGKYAYDLNRNGVYFHYWNTAMNAPDYNDGADGLRHLDYAVSEAGKYGLKLILTLTNTWKYQGGIPQYLEWYGMEGLDYPNPVGDHNKFYTDARCKQAFKNWINHLVNRVNYYTGIAYKDDPTIMSWELMNEAEAGGAPTSTVYNWAVEMSAYLKQLDPNHLVGLGEQGYFSGRGQNWKYNGGTGTNFDDLILINTLDWGSYHLYPNYWDEAADWGQNTWIPEHINIGKNVNKPVLLGEFGWNEATKDTVYDNWTRKIETLDGAGWLFWRLIGRSYDGTYPSDSENFDIHSGDSAFYVLKAAAARMKARNNP